MKELMSSEWVATKESPREGESFNSTKKFIFFAGSARKTARAASKTQLNGFKPVKTGLMGRWYGAWAERSSAVAIAQSSLYIQR
jgi:hypothetical protein